MTIAPVEIEIVRRCNWKQKPCGACGLPKSNKVHRKPDKGGTCEFKLKTRCENCGLPKAHVDHLGQPPSWNELGSGSRAAYQRMRATWFGPLVELIEESGMPKGLDYVLVEGEVTFPKPATSKGPDQGNFRGPIEKMLGDVLEEGGWIENDNWAKYEFGNLAYRHEPGVSRTRLIFFPRVASEAEQISDRLEQFMGSLSFDRDVRIADGAFVHGMPDMAEGAR